MGSEVTWIGGTYGSCCTKNSREDQVFGYDTLTLEECIVKVRMWWGGGVCRIGKHDSRDSIQVCLISCNKLLNLKIGQRIRVNSCMRLSTYKSTHSISYPLSRWGDVASPMIRCVHVRSLKFKKPSYGSVICMHYALNL